MRALVRIELLGGLRVTTGSGPVSGFRTQKTLQLLAFLAYQLPRRSPRELLVDQLWPDSDPDAGRHSLSMALSTVRQQLEAPGPAGEGPVVEADRLAVRLNPHLVSTDVADFEAALKAAARSATESEALEKMAAAADLYTGELLPGFYDEWVFPEQQRLQELFFQALRRLVAGLERADDCDRALLYALRAVREDPLREDAYRDVIRLQMALGQVDQARRQYAELERRLKSELDAAPEEETRALLRCATRAARPEKRLPPTRDSSPPAQDAGSRPAAMAPAATLEPIGGAVPLDSRFYVVRSTDAEFQEAVARRDSIVLVKGARQVGKTSLLARGLQMARMQGARVLISHFQMFNQTQLESTDAFLRALAETIYEQLDLPTHPDDAWDARRGASPNLRRYLRREVIPNAPAPLVWAMDEVDRIFACPFGSEVFGLFRSWHDERALDPDGPWASLTLAIAYSTEAHLFITDITQSPFNVGTRLALDDFTIEQVEDLNRRYGAPLRNASEAARFHGLVGGHPYLVRRGLHEIAVHGTDIGLFEQMATADHWIYGDHLRRIGVLIAQDAILADALREVLAGCPCPSRSAFYRLRSAGVLSGDTSEEARLRCLLYARYLAQQFACNG